MDIKSGCDPEGVRLPIKIDSTSNGEFLPRPLERHNELSNALALERANTNRRRLGQSRRDFLISSCGAATTLLAMNEVRAATGQTGSYFALPAEAAMEEAAAASVLEGNEFIFDVQGHHIGDFEKWRVGVKRSLSFGFRFFAPHHGCDYRLPNDAIGGLNCLTGDAYIKEVFLDSDTQLAVLSTGPLKDRELLPEYGEAAATRAAVDALSGTKRLMIHGRCMPTYPGELEGMFEIAERWGICAWKSYTQFGPNETGYYLDDEEFGAPFIDNARRTGIKVICVHKGLPFPQMGSDNLKYRLCRDIGPAARQNPDITFIVYHSGYDPETPEGPYQKGGGSGIDVLIDSLQDNGIGHDGNVYAELGSTWHTVMRDPEQAAHVIGKLLKYVGEDRVIWVTDCIWYGSPQDQIQAFRAFQISDEYQQRYGYPKITTEIRRKVFGLNAAGPYQISPQEISRALQGDDIDQMKTAYAARPDPTFTTYGPRTRREFLSFLREEAEHG